MSEANAKIFIAARNKVHKCLIDHGVECDPLNLDNEHDDVYTMYAMFDQYDIALDRAIELIDGLTGSCPLDMYDYDCNCDSCDNNSKECWHKYLLDQAKRKGC